MDDIEFFGEVYPDRQKRKRRLRHRPESAQDAMDRDQDLADYVDLEMFGTDADAYGLDDIGCK